MTDEANPTGQNDIDTGDANGQPDGAANGDTGDTGQPDASAAAGGDEGNNAGNEPVVPESYEFNMPEGVEFPDSFQEQLSGAFKDANLTQEGADKLVAVLADSKAKAEQAEVTEFNEQLSAWADELKKDPEIGGDAFDENMGKTKEFLDKTLPEPIAEEFKGLLEETGIGQHPAMVKYFFHMAKNFPVGEDNPGGGEASVNKGSIESRLYPNEAKAS